VFRSILGARKAHQRRGRGFAGANEACGYRTAFAELPAWVLQVDVANWSSTASFGIEWEYVDTVIEDAERDAGEGRVEFRCICGSVSRVAHVIGYPISMKVFGRGLGG